MLNAKYIVQYQNDPKTREQNNTLAQPRKSALGNAWFVNSIKLVDNSDEEIVALKEENGFDPKNIAIVDKRYESLLGDEDLTKRDISASIKMDSYAPNYIVYSTNSKTNQIAIFSEIFYDLGWQAYIDNKPIGHFRADYVLRGLKIPAGNHKVEFKYSLNSFNIASIVSPVAVILMLLLFVLALYKDYFKSSEK